MYEFPRGARFYDWNSLPMVTVGGPEGRTFLNYAVEPPCEIVSIASLYSAREVDREAFEALRREHRRSFRFVATVTGRKPPIACIPGA